MGNSYKVKSYIIAALAVVLVVALAFLFSILNTNTTMDAYTETTAVALKRVQSELAAYISDCQKQVAGDTTLLTYKDPVGGGTFTRGEDGVVRNLIYISVPDSTEESIKSYTPVFKASLPDRAGAVICGYDEVFERLAEQNQSIVKLFDDTVHKEVVLVYMLGDYDIYSYALFPLDPFYNAQPAYDFADIYLLRPGGGGIVSSFSGGENKAIFSGFQERFDQYQGGTTFSFRGMQGEEEYLFVVLESKGLATVRIMGAAEQSAVGMHTGLMTLQTILFAASMSGVALAALILLYNEYKNRFDLITRTRTPAKYFEVKVTKQGNVISANKLFTDTFEVDELGTHLISSTAYFEKEITDSQPLFVKLDGKDGSEYYVDFVPFRKIYGYRLIGGNSSRFLKEYNEFKQKKQIDPYTNLPVYGELEKEVERILEEGNGIQCMLGYITPNNLDKISVMLGEYLFRQMMTHYAQHIEGVVKKYGKLYSMGSQGFMFFASDMQKANALVNVIQEIMKQLSEVIKINDNIINVDACCGFVVLDARDRSVNMDNIIYNCELALKNAIDNKKTRYFVSRSFKYEGQHTDFTEKGLIMSMIENREFEMYYQPQYAIDGLKLSGFEGLLRIVSERKKEITVDKLIAIAEQYGGMVELGRFVYEAAMDFAKEIQGSGIEIAINVSAVQLMQIGFTEYFLEAYRKRKLDRGSFNIEITEGTMVHSFDEVAAKLNILKENGVGTHIDDFGVAYSSMLYLQRLPVSVVKIDKSLVDEIVGNRGNAIITKGIIDIAKNLNMHCIAEGVENNEQVELLREMRCDIIQGFLMSKALDHEHALALVKEKK